MERRYKIVISNQNVYKEIELPPDTREIMVGTGPECEIRLHKELFFERFSISFTLRDDGTWTAGCSDNLYLANISSKDAGMPVSRSLSHGDILEVKYRKSDNTAFTVEFLIDFDSGKQRYERIIDISSVYSVSIGNDPNCNVVLNGDYVNHDLLFLTRQSDGLTLTVQRSSYGVYHNGRKVDAAVPLRDGDFFSLSDFFFFYKQGRLYTEIRGDVRVNGLYYEDQPSAEQYPKFSRSTRICEKINDEAIEILDPPPKPQKPKNNLFVRLLPSAGMLIAAGVMAVLGGTTMIILSGISAVSAVITAIITYRQSVKDFKESSEDRINKYNAYIEQKCGEISYYREEERAALERIYISPEEERRNFESFSFKLFDRTRGDTDFLCVRLGLGSVEAVRKIDYKKRERMEIEDDLQLLPERVCESYRYIANAPVVCDMKTADAVGVVGDAVFRSTMLKTMVVDLCARQFHTDVKMAFISESEHADAIRYLRFLPHVHDEKTDLRMIVTDDDSKRIIFELAYRELSERERNKSFDNWLVLFFYDECGFKSHPISRFVDKAAELGVTFVFFAGTNAEIPLGCDQLIVSDRPGVGRLLDAHGENEAREFAYTEISDVDAARVVQILAPVYTEEISLEGALTKNISLFQLLHIIAVDDLDLEQRWAATKVYRSMAAPIGISKAGTVELNLHDKAHGPHGLVAGTTGSGKSELLQTYILSMCTLFSPYEVAFVIIDFKGGGMVNQFRELPHLLGAITNIDGKETERSLKSIRAELQKRQRLFSQADVNHIDKYIQKYRDGGVAVPLPHLIVIVDEFAELKAEQPEFMKELISAARIGRSLGVHLILATQKPSGQVSEQIWSNSRFKLCLKVQSKEDSNEVLKSPLAAEIKEPGRAYLQVGNDEIFELFQSAYSGALEKSYDNSVKEFTISSVSDVGRRTPVYRQKNEKSGENSRTQLEALVSYVSDYCRTANIPKLPNIFLPPLEESIQYPERREDEVVSPVTTLPLGVYDDPENQEQGEYRLNIENQNLMIIGSSQSGKTNLLQTMIRGIADRYTPEEVTIYIIDFASMTLKNFEGLKHVGGVVISSEDEKLRNLFKLLFSEIELRKKKMLDLGVSSFSAYREAGRKDMPHIVVMIDNLTALKEMYFQDDAELLRLCRESISVGITIVVANSQTAGIGYRYLSSFAARIALFCNDSSEYGSLFDHCRERVEDIRGRCLIEIDKRLLDCQLYLAFQGEKEYERAGEIQRFIEKANENTGKRAFLIPEIPKLLTTPFILTRYGSEMQEDGSLVIGLDYGSVSASLIQPAALGILGVSGRAKSGKHNFIRYLVDLMEKTQPGATEVCIVDGVAKRLSDLKGMPNVKDYTILADKACEFMLALEARLKQRYDALAAGEENVLENASLLVLILNTPEAAEAVSANPKALEAFRNIMGRYKNLKSFILLGNYDNASVPYSSPDVIKKVKDLRQFVFFDDLANLKILDVPITTLREFKKPIEQGDAYFIKENEVVKIKTVRYSS